MDNVKAFPFPKKPKWQNRDDGKIEPPENWLMYTCHCGSEDFFIAKPNELWQPAVYCRACGESKKDWF